MPKWSFEAEYVQACSCDYGCPCEFQAPPSRGFCEGVGAWRIIRGTYGSTSLDGLGLAFAARWPQAIHLGNGTAAIFVDERATAEQRDALLQIASGQAGGMPFEIIAATLTTVLDPQFVPMTFELNGRNSSARIGDSIEIGLSPIKNPVTGDEEGVRIVHDTGFIFQQADVTAAPVCNARVQGLNFSWPDHAGFVAVTRYSN
jgi:hypothetical protein